MTNTMTRRHLELIAEAIASYGISKADKEDLVEHFINRLRHTNSNFNVERFTKACYEPVK
jgi:hypothetical protein